MSSVRERMEQSSSNGPDRAVTTDHTTSEWGTIKVTQRIENQRQVSYLLACSCGAQGQRVTQQELASGTVPVCRFCNGTGTAPGDARRTFGVAKERLKKEVISSPRARAEAAARAAEVANFEKGGQ
jgi:hypothetical protein